jgi:hypothetical protein
MIFYPWKTISSFDKIQFPQSRASKQKRSQSPVHKVHLDILYAQPRSNGDTVLEAQKTPSNAME